MTFTDAFIGSNYRGFLEYFVSIKIHKLKRFNVYT